MDALPVAGIDVGSSAVKVVAGRGRAAATHADARRGAASASAAAIRRRSPTTLFDAVPGARPALGRDDLDYVATTGEGETGRLPHRALLRHDDPRARRPVPRPRGARGARHRRAARPRGADGRARQGAGLPHDQPVRLGLGPVPREHLPLPRRHHRRDRPALARRPTTRRPARRSAPCWPRPT